ncbi:MAG: hypothetical protein P4L41_03730 [Flavipsychrobacter sp.]|nr:hypothetical protein [Flavipsychrobacter sp.]
MKRKIIFITICTMLAFTACKKNKTTPQQPIDEVIYPSYSMMKTGNYWIYRIYELDSNYATFDSLNTTDSIYVEKDTVIAGQTYYKYCQPEAAGSAVYTVKFLRDSLDYIVTSSGAIQFSSADFVSIFYTHYRIDLQHNISPMDTPFYLKEQMGDRNLQIIVPAGTYVTNSWQTTYFENAYFAQYGPVIRKTNIRYSAGIGKVSEILPYYLSDPNYRERRLIRYQLK